ncbi:MAG: GDYXXLXY domain-containing protein [Alcanivorax sp.]|nr:GDYXXLXY domain-containing protein [Alcanivorax sp.]
MSQSHHRLRDMADNVEHAAVDLRNRALSDKPMNWRAWLLMLVVLGQLLVLAGVYLGARYPLWVGEEVTLEVVPVDPRDMFRGNYARLEYAVSVVPAALFDAGDSNALPALRRGERVYVSVSRGDDGFWHATGLSRVQPEEGVFLRGRIVWSSGAFYRVRYGIEAWFAPKEKALALERDLVSGGVARIRVAPGGRAALAALEADASEMEASEMDASEIDSPASEADPG